MNREILRLAIPNIISNISIPLLSTVDTALMGHLSTEHLGAVGLGAMIFNFIYWNFGFLRMGTTGLTAQAFGRNDKKSITANLVKATLVSSSIAILVLVLANPLFSAASSLMNVIESQEVLVNTYFSIRVIDAPATLLLYVLMGWYFGMQNAYYPLIITVFINIVNIALSAFFVLKLEWGVSGVAWGTVIAQYSGVVFALVLLLGKYKEYCSLISIRFIKGLSGFLDFFKLNSNIFIRTLCLSSAFAFLYSQSSNYGPVVLASNVVLLQFLNWMSYGIDGFAFASESLVGRFKGAADEVNLNKSIRYSFVWGFALAVIYSALYTGFGNQLLYVFTNQEEVIRFTQKLLPWMMIMPILGFASYIWDGVFVGLVAGKAMRNSMILSFALYLIAYYACNPYVEYHAIWIALSVFLISRAAFQFLLYRMQGNELT